MSKETIQDDFPNILLESITKKVSPVRSVLKKAKTRINAEDIRFRLRDWQDQSVVYVPHWIIGEGLEDAEPELARRVYYNPNEPSQMDCVIGLVARIARIKEEEASGKGDDNKLIQKLKDGVSEDEIKKQRIRFNNVAEEKVFKEFIDRLKKQANIWQEMANKWRKYLEYLTDHGGKNGSDESIFSKAIGQHAPWNYEENAEMKAEQWKQLIDYLRKRKERNEASEFLNAVKATVKRYELLLKQWEEYISLAEVPRCEIAVPVIAFGKFLGVLNFHKKDEFTESDERQAKSSAAQLAVVSLQRQTEQFEEFQRVARLMAAESNFEVIASKIAEGIRIGLRDGLNKNEVFPLLYVANSPIGQSDRMFDSLDDEVRFKKIWKMIWENTYYHRRQPGSEGTEDKEDIDLWETENDLGPIPIRHNGLGRAVIDKWRQHEEQIGKESATKNGHLFVVSLDVDDPNSGAGSRSALHHGIKTTGCLPLIFEQQVYGLLYLHCTKRHFFTDAELHALEISSTQAAIAINNARLTGNSYEELYGNKILDFLIGGDKDELL